MTLESQPHPRMYEKPSTFERIEEYKAILDNLTGFTARRQNANSVYVGLNTIFLTALGIFISSHLDFMKWATAVAVGIMTIPILFVNFIWRLSLDRYDAGQNERYVYLREIEQEFNERGASERHGSPAIGLFTRLEKLDRFGNVHIEQRLALFFFWFYPAVCIGVAAATWLVQAHLIPPLSL